MRPVPFHFIIGTVRIALPDEFLTLNILNALTCGRLPGSNVLSVPAQSLLPDHPAAGSYREQLRHEADQDQGSLPIELLPKLSSKSKLLLEKLSSKGELPVLERLSSKSELEVSG